MTSHANCTHPATKKDRAACRKAAASAPTDDLLDLRPTLRNGKVRYCDDCATRILGEGNFTTLSDLPYIACPCGTLFGDGTPLIKSAKWVAKD